MIKGAKKIESRENFEGALKRNRRSQNQRSIETIERLSKATIALMTEVGFVNMTTTSIAMRAGVSRGAARP